MSAAPAAAQLLEHEEDKYDGIIVSPDALPADPAAFGACLDASLAAWSAAAKHGVWLKVPLALAALIPEAVAPGRDFAFHHAEQDYVMLTRWLPTDRPNTLPTNASHQVGVGAFVVNDQQQVLVVQEANGPLRGQGFWKMPTGLVHAGEDLIDAVEREVLEETGIRAQFDCLIAVRQAHGFLFGKSDLFFCCGLRLAPGADASQLTRCEREIADVRWMPLEGYKQQPYFARLPPAYHTLLDACLAWAQGRYTGLQGHVFEGLPSRPRRDVLFWGHETAAAAAAGGTAAGAAAGNGQQAAAAVAAAVAGASTGSSGGGSSRQGGGRM